MKAAWFRQCPRQCWLLQSIDVDISLINLALSIPKSHLNYFLACPGFWSRRISKARCPAEFTRLTPSSYAGWAQTFPRPYLHTNQCYLIVLRIVRFGLLFTMMQHSSALQTQVRPCACLTARGQPSASLRIPNAPSRLSAPQRRITSRGYAHHAARLSSRVLCSAQQATGEGASTLTVVDQYKLQIYSTSSWW